MKEKILREHLMLDYTAEYVLPLTKFISKDDRLIFASIDSDKNDCVTSIDLETGEVVWRVVMPSEVHSNVVLGDGIVVYGTTILDFCTGQVIVDLNGLMTTFLERDLEYEYVYSFENEYLICKDRSNRSPSYFCYNIEDCSNKIVNLGFVINPLHCISNYAYGVVNGDVVCFDLSANSKVWVRSLDVSNDEFFRIRFYEDFLYLKYASKIYQLEKRSGKIVREYNLDAALVVLGGDLSAVGSTYFHVSKEYVFFGKECVDPRSNKSWLCVLNRESFESVVISRYALKGAIAFKGDFVFTLDEDDYPIALSLPNLETEWVGKKQINCRHILNNNRFVAYSFSGGGFQVYKK